MSKIEKIIARQQERIAEGQFYEAHQQLRVVASRYVKTSSWPAAIDILYGGALALLKAGQGGSGGDLCLYLVDVYGKAELEVDSESKGRIFTLLRAFPPDEPTRKRFIGEALAWTAKFGEYEYGDPELHHIAGTLYAESCEPYDSERHFALGTRDSPEQLALLEYTWYAQDAPHTAAVYCARAVFPYLLTRNLRSAYKAYNTFTAQLSSSLSGAHLAVQSVSSQTSDVRIYPVLPLLNFLGLLLLAVQRGGSDVYRQLSRHYAEQLRDQTGGAWEEALARIGEMYFGIKIPKQGNPLMDMMGSMLFGGGGGGAGGAGGAGSGSKPASKKKTIGPTPPAAVDLD